MAIGIGTIAGFAGNILGSLSPHRGDKRAKRDEIRNRLYQAGVSRSVFTDIHSNNWDELKKIYDFVQHNGQPAIEYLNETRPRTPGADWAAGIISRYDSWAARNVQTTGAAGAPSSNPNSQPVKAGVLGLGSLSNNPVVLVVAAVAAFFFAKNQGWIKA